jgi:hypothetical protein
VKGSSDISAATETKERPVRNSIHLKCAHSILWLAVSLLLLVRPASGQTDYSLRTQALSYHFAGIIEDALTDIYLNPARAGLIGRREVYAVKLREKTVDIPFPTSGGLSRYPGIRLTLLEDEFVTFRYTPFSVNVLTPIGGSLKASFGFEAALSNSNDLSTEADLAIDSYEILEEYERTSLYERDRNHAALSVALAAPLGDSYAGARLYAAYDNEEYRSISDRIIYRMPTDLSGDIYFRQDYDLSIRDFERTSFAFETGLYRPGRFLSDMVLRFGWRRSLFPVMRSDSYYWNEDYDGNGNSINGGHPDLYFEDIAYGSDRDYSETALHGRVHLDIGKGIRATQVVSWSGGDGDGSALYNYVEDRREAPTELFTHDLSFRYDGDYSNLYVSSAIGQTRQIHDKVSVTVGAKAVWQRRNFNENGSGGSYTLYASELYPDTLMLESGYRQAYRNDEDYYYLVLPLALECRLHKYVCLQMSAELVGVYSDNENMYRQDVSLDSNPVLLNERLDSVEYLLESSTAMRYNNGLTVNIEDRVLVDMIYGSSSSVGFASFGYLSVRYRF